MRARMDVGAEWGDFDICLGAHGAFLHGKAIPFRIFELYHLSIERLYPQLQSVTWLVLRIIEDERSRQRLTTANTIFLARRLVVGESLNWKISSFLMIVGVNKVPGVPEPSI